MMGMINLLEMVEEIHSEEELEEIGNEAKLFANKVNPK